MAFTQSDVDKLESAIATGALKVRYADGSEVTYRSLDEMERTLRKMKDSATVATGGASGSRVRVAGF